MSGQLEDTVAISREITHGYYAGNLEPYLSRLCSKSVWLGTGGRVLIGGDIIRARLFEYLSAGRPIVAMLRPDQVEHFPDVVYGAHSPAEFASLCSRALEERGPWVRERRREYGRAAAWSERANEVNRILESIGLFT